MNGHMLSIGAFAHIGQVTHRQLRHWDAAGLLVPAHVDELTGYRSYDPAQLQQLHRIVALRRLGFSIGDIVAMLDEGVSTAFLTEQLRAGQADVEREHRIAEARLVDVERRLRLIETKNTMAPIEYVEKPLPALRLAARTTVVPEQPDIAGFAGLLSTPLPMSSAMRRARWTLQSLSTSPPTKAYRSRSDTFTTGRRQRVSRSSRCLLPLAPPAACTWGRWNTSRIAGRRYTRQSLTVALCLPVCAANSVFVPTPTTRQVG